MKILKKILIATTSSILGGIFPLVVLHLLSLTNAFPELDSIPYESLIPFILLSSILGFIFSLIYLRKSGAHSKKSK